MNTITAAEQTFTSETTNMDSLWAYLSRLQTCADIYIGSYRPISHEAPSFNVYLTDSLIERLNSDSLFASLFAAELSQYPLIRTMSMEIFCSGEGKALEIRLYNFPYDRGKRKICIDTSIGPIYQELDLQFRRFQPAGI